MSVEDVDDYLAGVAEPQHSALVGLRTLLAELLPESEQVIAYGVPCFKVDGNGVAGFAAYANHCSYLPMSGSITSELADELQGLTTSKGSIRFTVDEPLPDELVRRLVDARLREIGRTGR